mmetsp:Transcript_11304/g.34595  ORF Transcript_11304/g.34595 Transcript_11304/m.34595 type:complete len:949 (+) Transcript_11304:176-3022(+)|eukprot:CAMPEP_0198729130 /NCGR_PEP_ID=MMETSP1475-20131203/14889_1 /TAXON_ID= ORGANISM="Unidentified sp., Strain CCMP1999" /NCGR_SAMPLE_ID=MMETSP1475 /ASSEMBLY_ACC=CAM_ASM_001111 /LENGTH=948 /DNA_ID=CAMNT_0044491699 /DNA_START=86 /DNA_END=2932 /DNA_ORIENTATION=+
MAGFGSSISQRLFGTSPSTIASTFQGLSREEVEELIRLRTLREIPKARFAAAVALRVYPQGRGRKGIFSHVDVYRYVENVATSLREVGVRPGSVCAFALPNTIEAIVYFLAVQWANGIALPINPDLDEETMAGILSRSKAKTFVTMDVDEDDRADDASYQKLQRVAQSVGVIHWHCYTTRNQGVVLETHGVRAGESAAWHGGAGDYGADPESTAVIMVSDAKDPPALLPLSHRNFCTAAKVFTSTYHLNQKKCTVFSSPVYSVHGILLLVSSFYSGGSLILAPTGAYNVAQTWEFIEEDQMTHLCISAEQILSLYETAHVVQKDTTQQLDFIRSCPGTIDTKVISIETLEETLKTSVLESYGTAESSGLVTANTEFDQKRGTHGKAVTGCEVAILDPTTRQKLGPNVQGDIAVRGETVPTDGYLNDDSFNEWACVVDEQGDEWFCTGDRGQMDEDGHLTVFGNSWAARKKEIDTHNMAAIPTSTRALDVPAEPVEEEPAQSGPTDEEVAMLEKARQENLERQMQEQADQEVAEAEARAREFERSLPPNEYQNMRRELEQNDPATSSLVTRSLAGDDEEYRALASGDTVRKQELLLESLRDEARKRAVTREEEDMNRARREADMRSDRMTRERQFMEETEVEFRHKIDKILSLSSQQQEIDQDNRGAIVEKLREVSERQARLEAQFNDEHKRTMDELSVRINQLNREIGQLSEANFIAKSAALSGQSAPMMIELTMDEADAAAIAAAASAEEANQSAKTATQRALAISSMAEEAAVMAKEAATKASETAARCNEAANIAHEAGLLLPPKKETEVHEVLAAAPENLNSIERRLRVDMEDVDKAMMLHPAVEKAVAFPIPDSKAGYDIAVAVKTKPGAKVTDTWLKLHAQSILPALAVPNRWYWIPDIPNGMTRDEVSVSDDLIDFERLRNRPKSKRMVQPPTFQEKEPSM